MTARLFAAAARDAFIEADDYLPRWPYAACAAVFALFVAPHAWFKHIDAVVCDALDVDFGDTHDRR